MKFYALKGSDFCRFTAERQEYVQPTQDSILTGLREKEGARSEIKDSVRPDHDLTSLGRTVRKSSGVGRIGGQV